MTIEAPASSNSFFTSSAFSLLTDSRIGLGTDSIRSFASFKPKEVKLLTTLITVILLDAGTSLIITSNSVFSSTAVSSALPTKLAEEKFVGATDMLASTPKVSSKKLS